jgi:hypothetical protein
VAAAFYNFHPDMVGRAVPGCWEAVAPAALTVIRAGAAARALTELCGPDALGAASDALPHLRTAVAHCAGEGRMLTGANRALWPSVRTGLDGEGLSGSLMDTAEVWQGCTTLREHRGDGHVAALTTHDLGGLEAHVLAAGTSGVPVEVLRDNRGWSEPQWGDAVERLARRQLVDGAGVVTGRGQAVHSSVETLTDELAAVAFSALDDEDVATLHAALLACAEPVQSSGLIPFPNPMGLPRV